MTLRPISPKGRFCLLSILPCYWPSPFITRSVILRLLPIFSRGGFRLSGNPLKSATPTVPSNGAAKPLLTQDYRRGISSSP